jgi:hypothetical protein
VSNGGVFTLYIGDNTITGRSYYAKMVSQEPVVVSKYGRNSVINLIGSPSIIEPPTLIPETNGSGKKEISENQESLKPFLIIEEVIEESRTSFYSKLRYLYL